MPFFPGPKASPTYIHTPVTIIGHTVGNFAKLTTVTKVYHIQREGSHVRVCSPIPVECLY